MARRHGYGLPNGVLEEVVQEAFLALVNPSLAPFSRTGGRGTARQYLLGRLLNAVKTVQVREGLRRTGSDFEAEAQRQFVPLEDAVVPPAFGASLSAIHARHLVSRMFAGLGADVAQACRRVWAEGEPLAAVALDLGMSRIALARKLSAVKKVCAEFAAFV